MNPFMYGSTVDGEFFCPRPDLERELASRLETGQNVIVQGERRTGKTSLVLETVRGMKGMALFHADLLCVSDTADLCARLVSALSRLEQTEGWLAKLIGALGHLRPTVTIDPQSGSPTLSVDARIASAPSTLDAVMDAIVAQTAHRRVCVVLDEFQDILDIEGCERALAVMRARIQLDIRTPYVFLGSVRNRMSDLFFRHSGPFYHSAASLPVGGIDADDFHRFLKARFATGSRDFPRDVFDAVSVAANGIPGHIQELCDSIWQESSPGETITSGLLGAALSRILSREQEHYAFALRTLTPLQTRVLKAIAGHGGAALYLAGFLEAARAVHTNSVKRAVEKLEKEELVCHVEGECRIANPFFAEWVRRL